MKLNQEPTIDINQLRDYSSLFSTKNVAKWLDGDFSSIKTKISRYNETWLDENKSCFDYLRHVYKVLEENYQNEYIFKNTFLNTELSKPPLKEDTKNPDVKWFNEFKVGNSIADLAMFNGKSIAFEIKTEMDSCKRLEAQIKSYTKIFNQVYLIIPESKLSTYARYDVGIITFNPNQKKFKHRKQSPTYTINPDAIMNILHTSEYRSIVRQHYYSLPKNINSFNQFELCSKLIKDIPIKKLNKYFIHHIKQRNVVSNDVLMFKNFKEFKQLGNALKMTKTQYQTMVTQLKLPIEYNL